jgi:hypothetical protein
MERATVFVLGLDEPNLERLPRLPDGPAEDFRPLISAGRHVQSTESFTKVSFRWTT